MNKLFDNSHFIAMQFNKSKNLNSHLFGFKNYNIPKQKNVVQVFPNDDISTWDEVLKYIEFLNSKNVFESISVACLSEELFCDIFGFSEQEYKNYIGYGSKEMKSACVEEDFQWFEYTEPYELKIRYRIPKELVFGSIVRNKNGELGFIANKNYIDNLNDDEKNEFIELYRELILNEVRNEDLDDKYAFRDIKKFKAREI